MTDKERYATTKTWERIFREEGFDINDSTIHKRMRDAGIIGATARNKAGRLVKFGFYSEWQVRELCSDLFHQYPLADADGFIHFEGRRYGVKSSLASAFGVTESFIGKQIRSAALVSIKGKLRSGHVVDFYSESEVRGLIPPKLPQADEEGFLTLDGVRYGTVSSYTRLFGLSDRPIRLRIKDLKPVKGCVRGKVRNFYSEPEVFSLCADILADLPRAEADGSLFFSGLTYRSITSISERFGVAPHAIRNRLQRRPFPPVKAKLSDGQICDLFPEAEIRKLCQDLLASDCKADENNILVYEGERYSTRCNLASLFGVSPATVDSKIRAASLQPMRGKDSLNRPFDFYNVASVRDLFADNFHNCHKADEDGLINLDGERYATVGKWAEFLNVSETTIARKCQIAALNAIRGRTKSNRISQFYAENDIRQILFDLLQDLPEADENGFIEIDGERYGTSNKWARVLQLNYASVARILKKNPLPSIKGRLRGGQIRDFYAESDIRRICADLIAKKSKK